jgi:sucrose phosphatase-like protein
MEHGTMKLLSTDVDNTITGDRNSYRRLVDILLSHQQTIRLVYVTGRSKVQMFEIMYDENLLEPECMICNVGTDIYMKPDYRRDDAWAEYIDHNWNRLDVARALTSVPNLFEQSRQFEFKQSYHLLHGAETIIPQIRRTLDEIGIAHTICYSSGADLDIIPARAGKGKAVDYVRKKFGIDKKRVLAAGDSGNDMELLSMGFMSVVVGNHKSELKVEKLPANVFWATQNYAAGVIEGMEHYHFVHCARDSRY